MYKEIFTARLKHSREQMGLKQEDMARSLGIARSTYTLWEIGKNEPDIESIGKITEILGVDLAWLVGTEGNHKIKS